MSAQPRPAEEVAREIVPDAGWLQLGTHGVRLASDVSVPHARAILARLIEQSRAEGAAAERERIVTRLRRMAQDSENVRNASAWTTAADIIESEDALYAETQQPRDLAGRIRGLVLTYTERWIDDIGAELPALREAMSLMRDVVQSGADVETVLMLIGQLRTKEGRAAHLFVFRQAADELEAIVRECEETKR